MTDMDVLRVVGHKRQKDTWMGALMFLFIAAVLGSAIIDDDPRALWEKLPGLFFCSGVPTAVGLSIFFYRTGLFVDRRARTATTWWGVGFPWSRKTQPLGPEPRIRFSSERRKMPKSGMMTFYLATLEGGPEPLVFQNHPEYEPVRESAEEVARYLGVPLEDATRDSLEKAQQVHDAMQTALQAQEVPGWAKQFVQDRMVAAAREQGLEGFRAPGVTTSQLEGGTRVVHIPPSGEKAPFVGALLIAGVFGGVLYASRASLLRDPWFMALFGGGMGLFLLVFLVQAEHRRGLQHWLRASREGLEVESRWLFGHKRVLLPARSLQQVEVVRGSDSGTWRHAELLLRGEGQQVRVGWHVPVAELRHRARELREAAGLPSEVSEGQG
jgi:hypothetical protein